PPFFTTASIARTVVYLQHGGWQAKPSQARCCERDLQSRGRRWPLFHRVGDLSRSQPTLRCSDVFHAHECIGCAGHATITKAHQTLHVRVIDHAVCHSRASHSWASCSLIDEDSNPRRMRVFLSKSTAVKPG